MLFISGRGKARANKRKSVNRQELARSLRLGLGFCGKKSVSRGSSSTVCLRACVCVHVRAKRDENRYYVNVSKSGHSGFKAYTAVVGLVLKRDTIWGFVNYKQDKSEHP